MNNQKFFKYFRGNKKKVYASFIILFIFIFIFSTNIIMIPTELKAYVDNHWYIKTMFIAFFLLILSLPLVRSYKEKNIEDWHLSFNKLFWAFLIGLISLTNVRNSYLQNISHQDKVIKHLNKEIEKIKQVQNKNK